MLDLRLLGPAATAWAACALVLALPSLASAWVVAAAACLAFVNAMIALRTRRTRLRVAAVSAAAGFVAVISACTHLLAIADNPIASAAVDRVSATVQAVVTGDPVAIDAAGGGSRWLVRARVQQFEVRDSRTQMDVPISLFLDERVPVGAVVEVSGRLAQSMSGAQVSASLDVDSLTVLHAPDVLAAAATELRAGLVRSLDGVDPDSAALVAGLAVGDESMAPEVLVADMRSSGLSHLTAVSGGNVAIVIAAMLLLGRMLALGTPWRVALAALALSFFVILVRPEPSVLRAAVMGAVSLLALTTGSRSRGIPALCAAVIVLVLLAPGLALALGFVLSVAATAGLLLLAPRIRGHLDGARLTKRLPPVLRLALAVALAAQIATTPFIAGLGSGLSLTSVPANLVVAPAVPVVTILGLAASVASAFSPHLAWLLAHCAAPGAWWIAFVAHLAARLPLGVVPWPAGVVGGALLVALMLAGWCLWRLRARLGVRVPGPLAAALAATLVVVVCVRPPGAWPVTGWVLVACDVGQGDGLVIRTGNSSAVLVDVGPDPAAIARCVRDLGISDIPAVVLTHFHADHVDGLPAVLQGYNVGVVLVSPVRDPLLQADKVQAWCQSAGVPVVPVSAGDIRAIGTVTWSTVWPARVIRDGSVPNNSSVALLVDSAGLKILLTGDIEYAAQVAIRGALGDSRVDLVKVPHHGSRMVDTTFPEYVRARIALVSVGRSNDYGHPDPGTMAGWEGSGAIVARTDLDGDVAVLDDGTVVRRGVDG